MESWSPSDVVAVVAVVSSVLALIVSTTLQWSLSSRRQNHEVVLEQTKITEARISRQTERSASAAADLLVVVDSIRDVFAVRREDGDGPDPGELRTHYDAMRRRIPEILDSEARTKLEAAADVFYYWNDTRYMGHGTAGKISFNASRAAREILGAVLRGEDLPETPELAELYQSHLDYQEMRAEEWEDHKQALREEIYKAE